MFQLLLQYKFYYIYNITKMWGREGGAEICLLRGNNTNKFGNTKFDCFALVLKFVDTNIYFGWFLIVLLKFVSIISLVI